MNGTQHSHIIVRRRREKNGCEGFYMTSLISSKNKLDYLDI